MNWITGTRFWLEERQRNTIMTTVRKHIRRAHSVKAHFRNGKWIPAYQMPECEIPQHLRRN